MSNKAKMGIVLLVVVAAGLPLAAKLMQRNAGGALQQEYDRIKAQGEPLTFEQLDAWYERPPDNAAELYLKAFAAHVEPAPGLESALPWEKGGAKLPPEGQPLSDTMRQAVQKHVRQNASSLTLLREAVTHPHCRYPIDLGKGGAAELEHLAKVRRAARLLADQAVLLAGTGSPDETVESLAGVFALANSLQDEPLLISQLVRTACVQIGIDALTWVVHQASLNDAQLAKLSNALDPFSNERSFWRAYAGERCIQIGTWDVRMGPGPASVSLNLDVNAIQRHTQSAVFEKDSAYSLRVLGLTIEAAKLPPDEGQSKLQEATKLVQEAPSDYLITSGKGPFENVTNLAGFLRSVQAREKMVQTSRAAAAALSATRR